MARAKAPCYGLRSKQGKLMFFFSSIRGGGKPDYVFIGTVFALVAFGLIALASASSDLGKIRFNDTYYYLKHQVLYGLSVGLIAFFICYKIPYKFWKKIAPFLFLGGIALLAATLFTPLGFSSGGSTRWINLGVLSFQPSEVLKAVFLVYLAAWLARSGTTRKTNFKSGFLPFLLLSGVAAILLIMQPATSAAVILLGSAAIVYFVSGAKITHFIFIAILGLIGLALIIYLSPYRLERVTSFLNPESDLAGAGFHLDQARTTIGAGGLTGVGYGKSGNKYKYLPESVGDSIFAVIAEEFGFIGATILIFIFFVLLLRGFLIARGVRDEFGKLLMLGFTCLLGLQTFINIAAISGLMPLTGVTLPFISYGSTSLVVFLAMSGLMVNISKYR